MSAGFAPLAVGTETVGSLVLPAIRGALYTMKPTHGIVPTEGIIPLSGRFDSAGPMAKSAEDLAHLLNVLVDPSKTHIPGGSYTSALKRRDQCSLKVGTLDSTRWQLGLPLMRNVPEVAEQIVSLLEPISRSLG